MQLHAIVFMRRIGHGKRSPLTVRQDNLQVLAGRKFSAYTGRKAQLQLEHVASHTFVAKHRRGVSLARAGVDAVPGARRDQQVARRLSPAKQMLVGCVDSCLVAATARAGDQLPRH